jgi:mono/diheme cytochrome c family protein
VVDWKTLRPLLIAALVLTPVGALLALGYIKSGVFNVGASKPHTKLTQWITEETMIHSIRSHAKGIDAPARAGATEVRRGFCIYATHCVTCHGAAAVPREHWAGGLEPQPPYLLDAADRWRPRELFWIVKNGIKMTGMPSWRDSLSDEEVWDVVAWLRASRELPPQTFLSWRSQRFCPVGDPEIGQSTSRSRH